MSFETRTGRAKEGQRAPESQAREVYVAISRARSRAAASMLGQLLNSPLGATPEEVLTGFRAERDLAALILLTLAVLACPKVRGQQRELAQRALTDLRVRQRSRLRQEGEVRAELREP